jgi:cell division protein FtsX
VIGVARDELFESLDLPPEPEVYQLYAQSTETSPTLYLVVRSPRESAAIAADLRGVLRDVDPTMPLAEVATIRQLMRESGARRRFGTLLLAGFATLALTLALVGVYGVAAQFVAQRRRELAIRLALGASDGRLVRLVLREGLVTALLGVAVGFAVAFGLSGAMRDLTFEVRPTDPLTYLVSAALLLAAILLATFMPARRASRLPPAVVLSGE